MPQIYMILAPGVERVLADKFPLLGSLLIRTVEEAWGLEDLNDVAFTGCCPTICVINEHKVQIEIRYTAGEDEYDRGEPFNPTPTKQRELAKQIKDTFFKFLATYSLRHLSLSVWCKPYYNGAFEEFD